MSLEAQVPLEVGRPNQEAYRLAWEAGRDAAAEVLARLLKPAEAEVPWLPLVPLAVRRLACPCVQGDKQ